MNFSIKRNHVFIKFCPIKARITPIQVRLAIVIYPYGGVNIIAVRCCQMVSVQGVFERTFGFVCYGNIDGSAATPDGYIVIIFAVPAHNLCGPVVVLVCAPMETFARKYKCATISPVYHIGGAGNTPAVHGEKSATFVVASINTDGIAKHNRGGVRRIVSLKNRIFCQGNGA